MLLTGVEFLAVRIVVCMLISADLVCSVCVCVCVCVCSVVQHHHQDFGPGGSGHAVAWAFLRLQGLKQQQLGQPLQLQLQLYNYKPGEWGSAPIIATHTETVMQRQMECGWVCVSGLCISTVNSKVQVCSATLWLCM